MKIQATKEYYGPSYDGLSRFILYWYQKEVILQSGFKDRILEIGKGTGFLKNYFSLFGIKITTLDHNIELNPDIVMDIDDLGMLKDKFNVVCLFDVIEHIPFDKVTILFGHINRILEKEGIFSFHTPYMPLPLPNRPLHNGQHYWEFGKWGYSKKKIEAIIDRFFTIEKCFRTKSEIFYVMKKKE